MITQQIPRKALSATRQAVSAFFFMQGFIFASWASRIPNIQQMLSLDDGALGTVLLALPLGLLVSLPLSGWLVTRIGSRKAAVISVILYAIILPTLGLVHLIWQLVMILFFFGLVGNLVNISVNTQAVGVEARYQRSIMSAFHGLWSLAGFCAAAISTFLISMDLTILQHFCISSAFVLLMLCVAYRYLLPQDLDAPEGQEPKMRSPFMVPGRNLLMLGLIGFCGMLCEGTMFDWSGIYFSKVVQVSPEITTLGYTAFMSTMAGGRFVGDLLVNRFGTYTIIRVNGLLVALGLLLSVVFPALATATLGFLLVGLGVSTIVPLVYAAAGKTVNMSPSVALASVSSISFLGFLAGPPLIGYMSELTSLRWAFLMVAVLGLVIMGLAGRVNRKAVRMQ